MSIVITFTRYRPSPRDDNVKWISAQAQQAPDTDGQAGAFSTIETFAIPNYSDPTDPPTLSFTTDQATLSPGWYRLRFTDIGPGEEFTAPRYYDQSSLRPGTRDVAVHIKNRTVDDNNNYVGDFTNTTAVTADEVEELIAKAEQRVLRKLDVDPNESIPTESQQAVTDLMALYAAMLVELTKFGEQVQANRSPYQHLRDLYNEQLNEVLIDIRGPQAVPSTGAGSKSVWDLVALQSNIPHSAFPNPETINWDSKF